MPEKIRHKVEQTRQKILSKAQAMFENLIFTKVTMADIAKTASVARATLYRYFRTKREIFAATIQEERNYVENKLRLILKRNDNTINKLKQYAHIRFEVSARLVKMYHLNSETISRYLPEVLQNYQELMDYELELVGYTIKEGIRKGELAVENPEKSAELLVSTVHGFELLRLFEPASGDIHKDIDSLIDTLIIGIGEKSSGKVLTGKNIEPCKIR